MTSRNYAYQTFDDIVFEGRNREYGAYLLRKVYTQNLWRGLAIAIGVFMLFLSIPLLVAKVWPEEVYIAPAPPKTPGLTIIDVVIPDIPKIEPIKPEITPPQTQKVKTTKYTVPVIIKNNTKASDVPDQGLLHNTIIGSKNSDGDTGVKPTVIAGQDTKTGTGAEEVIQPILFNADQMPEFPGGMAAMQKYLANNIVYPNIAKRSGLEGTVILSFVVNPEGEISGIQVLKTLGGGTEAEAIRVLKSMPRWNPGKNNGIPVSVRFTVPIRFALQ